MSRELATTVILVDETGQPKVFNEGDTPTKKWADQIDNPKAWRDSDGEAAEVVDEEPEDDVDDDDDSDTSDEDEQGDDSDEEKAPAKSAKVEVWKEYAESKGIELADDATKKDYQDAVAAL
jgi:hypothetical protein